VKSFYINRANPQLGGPATFGWRLKQELLRQGHDFKKDAGNNIAIIDGGYKDNSFNLLRLDGLCLDSSDPNCNIKNEPIFECYKNFDHIVFQSKFCRDVYESFTGVKKPHSIIYNGVPSSFSPHISHPHVENFDKVVIASAKWRRHKRLEEVMEAFSSPKLKGVALLVLDGQRYKPAVDYVKSTQAHNIILFPKISHDKLPEIYVTADAMVHLSWIDWCPNTVVEGLACGLPVLCSHNGGTSELVKDNGVILQLEEDYSLGSTVDLYNPPSVDREIIINGILEVLGKPSGFERSDLSIASVGEQYINLLK